MWVGAFVEQFDVEDALKLATLMLGVLSPASKVEVVRAGNEPRDFFENVEQDGPYDSSLSLDLPRSLAFQSGDGCPEGTRQRRGGHSRSSNQHTAYRRGTQTK